MKKKEAIELHNILSTCKLTGMNSTSKVIILNAMRKLRPLAEAHEADVKNAVEKIKPEGFDELITKARQHNNAVNAGAKPLLSEKELEETSEIIDKYNKELGEYVNGLMEEEVDIELQKIDKDNMDKFLEANDMETSQLVVIYSHFSY